MVSLSNWYNCGVRKRLFLHLDGTSPHESVILRTHEKSEIFLCLPKYKTYTSRVSESLPPSSISCCPCISYWQADQSTDTFDIKSICDAQSFLFLKMYLKVVQLLWTTLWHCCQLLATQEQNATELPFQLLIVLMLLDMENTKNVTPMHFLSTEGKLQGNPTVVLFHPREIDFPCQAKRCNMTGAWLVKCKI